MYADAIINAGIENLKLDKLNEKLIIPRRNHSLILQLWFIYFHVYGNKSRSVVQHPYESFSKETLFWDFQWLSGPVVKALSFYCRRYGNKPWSGN